jgi:hypothetical protein
MSILDNVGSYVKPPPDAEFLAEDDAFSTQFPGIFEFLARIKVNGVQRKPGRLIIYFDAGKAHLCLSDKHTGSCAFHAAESVEEALEGVEKRLQGGGMDWRRDKRSRYS